jgi:hypothetical protein
MKNKIMNTIILLIFVQLVASMPQYGDYNEASNIGDYVQETPMPDYGVIYDITTEQSYGNEYAQSNFGEENDQFVQDDMILTAEQARLVFEDPNENDDVFERTGSLVESSRWPKNTQGKVILPYVIQETDYSELYL